MNTLIYSPDQSGYSVSDSSDRLKTDIGLASAFRRNLINGNRPVDVSWTCSKEIYTYLARAYRAFIKSGGTPFLCSLFLDKANVLGDFKCRFVVGSFGLTSVRGETYFVSARFSVEPDKYDVEVLPYLFDVSNRSINFACLIGNYVLTGQSVILKPSTLRFSVDRGLYAINGQSVDLRPSVLHMTAEGGVYNLTGKPANQNRIMIGVGSYSLTGQAVTLTHV